MNELIKELREACDKAETSYRKVEAYIEDNYWDSAWLHDHYDEVFAELRIVTVKFDTVNKMYKELAEKMDYDNCLSLIIDLEELANELEYWEADMRKKDEQDYDLYFSDREDMEEIGYTEEDIEFLEKNNGITVYRE